MLSSPLFHLSISFLVALYIGYKKIWPHIVSHLKIYSDKIKILLGELDADQKNVLEELHIIKKNSETVDQEIHIIFQEGQFKIEKLKESYAITMGSIIESEYSHAKKRMGTMQKKMIKSFYFFATHQIDKNLIEWSTLQSTNVDFQKMAISHQLNLLEEKLTR